VTNEEKSALAGSLYLERRRLQQDVAYLGARIEQMERQFRQLADICSACVAVPAGELPAGEEARKMVEVVDLAGNFDTAGVRRMLEKYEKARKQLAGVARSLEEIG
jgi:hypothetical protein